jgi:predicted unusual protein kinase regulating ubiquinone biosynthesis (AarF/ABC1/UbiB family)
VANRCTWPKRKFSITRATAKTSLRGHINALLRIENFVDELHEQLKEELDLKNGK